MGIRTIIFRGKRKDNGEWVYGDFMHGNERKSLRDSIFVYDSETQSFDDYEIDSSTIGQYTGLTDKNGKKIFEGDIISIPFEEDVVYYENAEVYFDTEHYGWYIRYSDYESFRLWVYDDCDIAVIGNIHDNPELLKGDKDNG